MPVEFVRLQPSAAEAFYESHAREALRAFARMVRAGLPPPITLGDGLWAVSMAEACYRSASSGGEAEVEAP